MFLVGALFPIAGLVGVLHLVRGRGVTVAQVGAVMMIFGAVFGNWFFVAVLETTAAQGPAWTARR